MEPRNALTEVLLEIRRIIDTLQLDLGETVQFFTADRSGRPWFAWWLVAELRAPFFGCLRHVLGQAGTLEGEHACVEELGNNLGDMIDAFLAGSVFDNLMIDRSTSVPRVFH